MVQRRRGTECQDSCVRCLRARSIGGIRERTEVTWASLDVVEPAERDLLKPRTLQASVRACDRRYLTTTEGVELVSLDLLVEVDDDVDDC